MVRFVTEKNLLVRRCLKLDFLSAARSLACEGRIRWASELSIHVYEGWYALVGGGGESESKWEEKEE